MVPNKITKTQLSEQNNITSNEFCACELNHGQWKFSSLFWQKNCEKFGGLKLIKFLKIFTIVILKKISIFWGLENLKYFWGQKISKKKKKTLDHGLVARYLPVVESWTRRRGWRQNRRKWQQWLRVVHWP